MDAPKKTAIYPTRQAFFACAFARLLAESNAAAELGAQAAWLLTVVVMKEDQFRYSRPVSFFNEQLMRMLGLGSVNALDRARAKCIKAGWLQYVPGGRRVGAGTYWVMIPSEYLEALRAPSADILLLSAGGEQNGGQSRSKPADPPALLSVGGEQSGSKPGPILPVPIPNPKDKAPPTPVPGESPSTPASTKRPQKPKPTRVPCPLFAQLWTAYPRKEAKAKAEQVFAKIAPDGALLDKMLTALAWQKRSEQWTKDGGRFIPHPTTWLNQRRWEDEEPTPTSNTHATAHVGPRTSTARSGHQVDAEPGKWAAPANKFGRQTRRSPGYAPGAPEPPAGQGGTEPGTPGAAA